MMPPAPRTSTALLSRVGSAALLLAVAVAFAPVESRGEGLTSEAIVRALAPAPADRPRPASRSLGAPAPPAAASVLPAGDAAYLRRLPSRGLRVEMKEKLVEIVQRNDLPRLDIEIGFAYNSAVLAAPSRADLDALGVALLADSLVDTRIALNGHTDAVGSERYNLELSERRAEAVRDYLIAVHGIAPERLIAVGFGESRLKNPARPAAGENRRVEVINLY
ncbi:OmpA family protein [Ancylobacter sp. IITR112]|uniref:OmpA family protein n=1 Tax=Ancylobacter sp. IITR112 TaxID=3138073 RepID=UPI003529DCE1